MDYIYLLLDWCPLVFSSSLWRHLILISSVYLPTSFIFLLGCQYEGYFFLPTRSKGNLHSICQWCDCKCYTASTRLLRWYSNLWGLFILTSEVIYILRSETDGWNLILTSHLTSMLAVVFSCAFLVVCICLLKRVLVDYFIQGGIWVHQLFILHY